MIVGILLLGLLSLAGAGETNASTFEQIDKNFRPAKVGAHEVRYYNAVEKPFVLEGFPWIHPGEPFYRLPAGLTAKEVSRNLLSLAHMTAGGVIRFRTDSSCIALRAELAYSRDLNHMSRAASAGFDLYQGTGGDSRYFRTAQPGPKQKVLEVMLAERQPAKMRDWTLFLPLYGGAEKIEIGLVPNARFEVPTPHTTKNPIVFYGSSITQGACASRPGNTYASMLCRAVDAPQINLGFSGNACGEPAIARAIASLDPAVFVLDYDHNAPSVEALERTHEPFFRIIRAQHPELPIIILSRCTYFPSAGDSRRDMIRRTFEHAVAAGDKKVWFIDGETLCGTEDRDTCTVDRIHPNDLGFYRMYQHILPVLQDAIKSNSPAK